MAAYDGLLETTKMTSLVLYLLTWLVDNPPSRQAHPREDGGALLECWLGPVPALDQM